MLLKFVIRWEAAEHSVNVIATDSTKEWLSWHREARIRLRYCWLPVFHEWENRKFILEPSRTSSRHPGSLSEIAAQLMYEGTAELEEMGYEIAVFLA